MRADTSLRAARPPRALPLSTGEDVPPGESVRARVLIVDVERGAINREILTEAQRKADVGLFATATGGFVRWLAPRLSAIRSSWGNRVEEQSAALPSIEGHRRSARMACELLAGLDLFLEFAVHVGAIGREQATSYYVDAKEAILEAVRRQADFRRGADPAESFLGAVGTALACGMAHVEPIGGLPTEFAAAYGWQLTNVGLRAAGQHIGWINAEGIYLDPLAAMSVVRRLDPTAASLSLDTLAKRLGEADYLAATDTRGGRTRFKVRKTIGGVRRDVLHLRIESVIGELDVGGRPGHAGTVGAGALAPAPVALVVAGELGTHEGDNQ